VGAIFHVSKKTVPFMKNLISSPEITDDRCFAGA
jgi:hypothetical protein